MDCLWIEGGKKLFGEVDIPPAKNAALPLLCLSLLTDEPVFFDELPDVEDIRSMIRLLQEMGVQQIDNRGFRCEKIVSVKAPYEWVTKMRASVLVLGPLLARAKAAEVSLPGGCAIGERPVDIHIAGLRAMGADIKVEAGYIRAKCDQLKGTRFVLNFPTVTGTINLITAAVLAEGESIFENVAREPEIIEVSEALISMGAVIEGHGTSSIRVKGQPKLRGMRHKIQPDRIQLLTYLAAGAITGGEVECRSYRQGSMSAVLQKFREMGCEIFETPHSVKLKAPRRLSPVHFETAPFPGFPTDGQAQFLASCTMADRLQGPSTIRETVFENRFGHVGELRRMGAQIEVKGNMAVVTGVDRLSGTTVMASDLRASACLVLAGLAAEGKTQVTRVYHLDRGYENLESKLAKLGARIWRAEA